MKLASFCFLTVLSLLYAGLTLAETLTYHKWEKAVNEQKYIQAEVAYFDHLNVILDEMVRRMAFASQHDPAMAQVLKDHNINVVIQNPTAQQPTTSSFDVTPPVNPSPSAAPVSKPDDASANSSTSHP